MEEEGVPAESISNIDHGLELKHRTNFVVNRPLYNEHEFMKDYDLRQRKKRTAKEKVKSWVKPGDINKKKVKKFFFGLMPILDWLPKYGIRSQLIPDFISGLIVGVFRLPQGMAHAILATVPPVYGLYTVFFPVIIYALFGTSKHISIGTFAVVSIMTGDAANKVIKEKYGNTELGEEEEVEIRIQIITSLAIMVGLIQITLGILHFGILSDYLPEPLIRGFTSGAAVHVFSSQFYKMFGVPVDKSVSGPLSIFRQYIPFFPGLRYANTTEIIVSLCAIILMVAVKEVQEKFKAKYTFLKYPIPVELIVIILGTVVSFLMDFEGSHGVKIVGTVPTGIPAPAWPTLMYVPYLISDAFVIAIVTFSIAVSMAYIFAKKHGYEIRANQELFAYGSSNFVGGVFSCFPSTASLSRSLVQELSGCTSQLASLISALLILIILLWLGPLFQTLPECCLAAIIVVALRGMFRQLKDIKILWKYSITDMIIWIVTFVSVVTFGLDIGLLVGVVFAIFTVVVRTQRPPCSIMGQIPKTDIYKDIKVFPVVQEIPGIKIFRIQAPFYFTNARYVRDLLYKKTGLSPPKILIQQAKEAKRAAATVEKSKEVYGNEVDIEMETQDISGNGSVVMSVSESVSEDPRIHTIILDFGAVSFVDTVGMNTLKSIITEYDSIDVNVLVANVRGSVRETFQKSGMIDTVGLEKMYVTVHDAVLTSSTNLMLTGSPTNIIEQINTANSLDVIPEEDPVITDSMLICDESCQIGDSDQRLELITLRNTHL